MNKENKTENLIMILLMITVGALILFTVYYYSQKGQALAKENEKKSSNTGESVQAQKVKKWTDANDLYEENVLKLSGVWYDDNNNEIVFSEFTKEEENENTPYAKKRKLDIYADDQGSKDYQYIYNLFGVLPNSSVRDYDWQLADDNLNENGFYVTKFLQPEDGKSLPKLPGDCKFEIKLLWTGHSSDAENKVGNYDDVRLLVYVDDITDSQLVIRNKTGQKITFNKK